MKKNQFTKEHVLTGNFIIGDVLCVISKLMPIKRRFKIHEAIRGNELNLLPDSKKIYFYQILIIFQITVVSKTTFY